MLAFVLLGAFAAGGWWAAAYVRVAPSTPVPAQALSGGRHKAHGETQLSPQPEAGPPWSALSTPQKEALAPLADRWSLLSEVQKRNWLKLAAGFPALPPEEQAKMLARITDWASLSAQQRSQARLNYAAARKLAHDSKRAQWEAYQALSDEEKKRLATKAAPKPAGAATAVRPISPKKFARVPAATNTPVTAPNPPKIPRPTEFLPQQALPVPPPVVVETTPIATPSAVPVPLPPLHPASGSEAVEDLSTPLHSPP